MILCVTPNPAVDRTLTVPTLRLGEPQRTTSSLVAAGGKGLNVARVARTLGSTVVCTGFAGGHSGRLMAELAEQEGFGAAWTWIERETRTCIILIDGQSHDATVINEPGPPVASDDWARLAAQVVERAPAAEVVCVSGSMPPGSTPADYAMLLRHVRATGCALWADTSEPGLRAAVELGGLGIKVNAAEAGELLGRTLAEPAEAAAAARELHARTGAPAIITLGGAGAVLANRAGSWHAAPPPIALASSVGSGDAALAGLAVALARGADAPTALRHAVAAGAANAMLIGGGRIELPAFRDILARTTLVQMA